MQINEWLQEINDDLELDQGDESDRCRHAILSGLVSLKEHHSDWEGETINDYQDGFLSGFVLGRCKVVLDQIAAETAISDDQLA